MISLIGLQPRLLRASYLIRWLALRAVLACVSLATMDAAVLALMSAGSEGASTWGWRGRVALAGLLTPLLFNLGGLLMPFLYLNHFEQHHSRINQVILDACTLGKLLQVLCGLPLPHADPLLVLLMHSTAGVVQQPSTEDYVRIAGRMALAAVASMVWQTPASLKPVAGLHSTSNVQMLESPAVDATIFMMQVANCYMLGVLLHHQFGARVSSRELPGQTMAAAAAAAAASLQRDGQSTGSSAMSAAGSVPGAAANEAPAVQHSRAYLMKLVVIKVCHAAAGAWFAARYCWFVKLQLDQVPQQGAWQDVLQVYAPGLVGLACAVPPAISAVCAISSSSWAQARLHRVNTATLYVGLALNLAFMWIQSHVAHAACSSRGVCLHTPPEHAFQVFLLLVASLRAHEEGVRAFAAQVTLLVAVLITAQHQLRVAASLSQLTSADCWFGKELPEYLVTSLAMMLTYNMCNVGREPEQGNAASKAGQAAAVRGELLNRLRRQGVRVTWQGDASGSETGAASSNCSTVPSARTSMGGQGQADKDGLGVLAACSRRSSTSGCAAPGMSGRAPSSFTSTAHSPRGAGVGQAPGVLQLPESGMMGAEEKRPSLRVPSLVTLPSFSPNSPRRPHPGPGAVELIKAVSPLSPRLASAEGAEGGISTPGSTSLPQLPVALGQTKQQQQQQQRQRQEEQQQQQLKEPQQHKLDRQPAGAIATGVSVSPGPDQQMQVLSGSGGPDTTLACRAVCDAVMAVLALGQIPVAVRLAHDVLSNPAAKLSAAGQALGVLGLVLAQLYVVGHILLTLLRPQQALRRRDWLWCLHTLAVPAALRIVLSSWRTPFPVPAHQSILLLSAAAGVMDVSVLSFAGVFPVTSLVYLVSHLAYNWSSNNVWLVAASIATFNFNPVVVYLLARYSMHQAQGLQAAILTAVRQMAGTRLSSKLHMQLAKACAVTSMLLVFGVFGKVLTMQGMKPPAVVTQAAEEAKLVLWDMAARMKLVGEWQNHHTMVAVVGACFLYLAASSLQAMILNHSRLRDPKRLRFEACKARIARLGEHTMNRLSQLEDQAGLTELESAVLEDLMEVCSASFPGAVVTMVLLEGSNQNAGCVQHYLVQGPPDACILESQQQLLVEEVPSVMHSCQGIQQIYQSFKTGADIQFTDWRTLHEQYGSTQFLVSPLSYATQSLGALLLANTPQTVIDRDMRALAEELSTSLSSTLHTLGYIRQLRAGEQIIQDVMPAQVADHLKRRVLGGRPTVALGVYPASGGTSLLASPLPAPRVLVAAPAGTSSANQALQHEGDQQQELRRAVQQLSQQQGLEGLLDSALAEELSGQGIQQCVPVVYQQWHPQVTVLFADIAGYTALSTQVEPEEVMLLLHELFSKYDHLCSRLGVYKVETIGDCYMACAGVVTEDPDHAQHMVMFGQALLAVAASVTSPLGGSVRIRVGVHSGRVMSGIVGSIRARYCLFGDTVNTASRMESTGVVDRIQVSENTYQLLGPLQSSFEPREAVSVKGKGLMKTYVLKEAAATQLKEQGMARPGCQWKMQ